MLRKFNHNSVVAVAAAVVVETVVQLQVVTAPAALVNEVFSVAARMEGSVPPTASWGWIRIRMARSAKTNYPRECNLS